jgi:hypothetical protein
MSVECHGGMILTGENQRIWTETCPSATMSTTNPTRTSVVINGLSQGTATFCLNRGHHLRTLHDNLLADTEEEWQE